jgi:hypothetical protein
MSISLPGTDMDLSAEYGPSARSSSYTPYGGVLPYRTPSS